jgi:GT2 family glycosyltransferase
MDVSVTIAHWNRADLLQECLRSVFATPSTVQYEVIVVDNASSDDSVALVREYFPQVHLIVNSDNVGFGRAHNQAMAVARGRYVLILNNDATVLPDTIPTLVGFMDRQPQAGACGCPDHGSAVPSVLTGGAFRRFPSLGQTFLENLWAVFRPAQRWDNSQIVRLVKRQIVGGPAAASEQEVAWVIGALLLLRRAAVEEIGTFDEQFFLFAEEKDLCRRMWAAGWKILFTTSTSYCHRGGASCELRTDIEKIRGESEAKYFQKYQGRLVATAFRLQHYVLRMCLLRWRNQFQQKICGQLSDSKKMRRPHSKME